MARPSRNDIREAAISFASEWSRDDRERGEAQTFWTEFLQVFGVERRRTNAAFERHARRSSTGGHGFIDLLWPGMLLVEHKSRGGDLDGALAQALDYIDDLDAKDLPRFVVVSDFARIRVLDLEPEVPQEFEFELVDFPREVDRLLALAGYRSRQLETQADVDVKAAGLLGHVHDELAASGYEPHSLRVFCVRTLFLLFADDAALWERNRFADLMRDRTSEDGSDLGMWMSRLFEVLNTNEKDRSNSLDEELAGFPFTNGGIFTEHITPPDTTRAIRDRLLEASNFNWAEISPAVFGSIFQSVMDPVNRRNLGAHYTSEADILKVLRPLVLDDLEKELETCGKSRKKLLEFHDKLGSLTFLDPACGCGNFLVVAYRELRRLERRVLGALHPGNVQMVTNIEGLRRVNLDQFFGIEIEEFPARIAETAMHLVDHLENEALGREFGVSVTELPLGKGASITTGNALQLEWDDVISPSKCDFIIGNPPYGGKHLLDEAQRSDMTHVFNGKRGSGSLDFVAAWFVLAARYMASNTSIRGAFVTTNSITQGEQVPILWPMLHSMGLHISFAWRTFNWMSEARGAAHVHVVIIGFDSTRGAVSPTIHEVGDSSGQSIERSVDSINGYLAPGPEEYPLSRSMPLRSTMPIVVYGAKPADGGHLLMNEEECERVRNTDEIASRYIRPLMSGTEFLNGEQRFCFWLENADPTDIVSSRELSERLKMVRDSRSLSTKAQTREMSKYPGLFAEVRRPKGDFIFVPRHSSATRTLIPMGFVSKEVEAIVHDSGAYVETNDMGLFGVLQSEMFALWQRTVGGRIKSDYRFNNRLVYNTFPFPELKQEEDAALGEAALAVLSARAEFQEATLSVLYNPVSMPPVLAEAHRELDRIADRVISRGKKVRNETERLAVLFDGYLTLSDGKLYP